MSRSKEETIKLGAFFYPTGHHIAAWLHPGSQIDADTNIGHYLDLARKAESAKYDFIFLADACATRSGNIDALKRWPAVHGVLRAPDIAV